MLERDLIILAAQTDSDLKTFTGLYKDLATVIVANTLQELKGALSLDSDRIPVVIIGQNQNNLWRPLDVAAYLRISTHRRNAAVLGYSEAQELNNQFQRQNVEVHTSPNKIFSRSQAFLQQFTTQ